MRNMRSSAVGGAKGNGLSGRLQRSGENFGKAYLRSTSSAEQNIVRMSLTAPCVIADVVQGEDGPIFELASVHSDTSWIYRVGVLAFNIQFFSAWILASIRDNMLYRHSMCSKRPCPFDRRPLSLVRSCSPQPQVMVTNDALLVRSISLIYSIYRWLLFRLCHDAHSIIAHSNRWAPKIYAETDEVRTCFCSFNQRREYVRSLMMTSLEVIKVQLIVFWMQQTSDTFVHAAPPITKQMGDNV